MFRVFIEMPLGNRSKPHEFDNVDEATKLFDSFVKQMQPWKKFQATVVMKGEGKVTTVEVNNA